MFWGEPLGYWAIGEIPVAAETIPAPVVVHITHKRKRIKTLPQSSWDYDNFTTLERRDKWPSV